MPEGHTQNTKCKITEIFFSKRLEYSNTMNFITVNSRNYKNFDKIEYNWRNSSNTEWDPLPGHMFETCSFARQYSGLVKKNFAGIGFCAWDINSDLTN
jgi:hypothetical protein